MKEKEIIRLKSLDKVRENSLKKVIQNIDFLNKIAITKDSLIFIKKK